MSYNLTEGSLARICAQNDEVQDAVVQVLGHKAINVSNKRKNIVPRIEFKRPYFSLDFLSQVSDPTGCSRILILLSVGWKWSGEVQVVAV